VIGRHHEHVVETLEGACIGPAPLLAAQAVDELEAHVFGSLVTARVRLASLEVLAAATPERPAIPALTLPSPPPETAGKSGSQL
jgi:hypothetical protein